MSLDIWLTVQADGGGRDTVSLQVYDTVSLQVYAANYTHNVGPMWVKAGCWEALYECQGKRAWEILEALEHAIEQMRAPPAEYEALNPSNGWGSYATALPWLEK